jgi:hypothetical protein
LDQKRSDNTRLILISIADTASIRRGVPLTKNKNIGNRKNKVVIKGEYMIYERVIF